MLFLQTRIFVALTGLSVITLLSITASARTWTEAELIAEGKDNWIWSDDDYEEMDTTIIRDFEDLDVIPKLDKWSRPKYPDKAKKTEVPVEGDVLVGVVLDHRGKVIHARVIEDSGLDVEFEKYAVESARKAKWHPAMINGNRVPVFFTYSQKFRARTTKWDEPVSMVDKWHWKVELEPVLSDDPDTTLPAHDEFVAAEEQPVLTKRSSPKYPEKARRALIEGSVWVKALLDTRGRVIEIMIMKDSGKGVGFEEAALQSALNTEWEPAYVNGEPVPIWVAYEVVFRLRGR